MPRSTLDSIPSGSNSQGYSPDNYFGPPPLLLTPAQAAQQLGLARYTVYQLVREGRLRAKRFGRLVLIPREEMERFAASLEEKR